MFERGNESVNLRGRWANDKNVINVNEKIKRCISLGAVKSEFELPSEFVIPLTWGLFETI